MKQRLILFTGGGTGGSVAPLVALAREVRERKPDVRLLFLTTKSIRERQLVNEDGFEARTFPAGKWRRYWDVRNVVDLFVVIYAFIRALFFLTALRPTLVVSAGSFLSVPVVWAAGILQIKVALHQQDVKKGLANALMTPCASVITVAFAESRALFPKRKRVLHTGNPVRDTLLHGNAEKARAAYAFPKDCPVVLVLGGSTGSQFLNTVVREASSALAKVSCVLHVVGNRGEPTVSENGRYHAVAFLEDDLADAYALADVVISRAGLSTLSELALLGKAAIVVPMPGTHQDENAEFFYNRQAIIAVQQSVLSAEMFIDMVGDLLENDRARQNLSRAIRTLAVPDAGGRIVNELLSFLSHGRS